jgi:hypothetical protein
MANAKISTPICARCKHERIIYKESDKTHILLPFALPADAPLDDESIKRYIVEFMQMSLEDAERDTEGTRRWYGHEAFIDHHPFITNTMIDFILALLSGFTITLG